MFCLLSCMNGNDNIKLLCRFNIHSPYSAKTRAWHFRNQIRTFETRIIYMYKEVSIYVKTAGWNKSTKKGRGRSKLERSLNVRQDRADPAWPRCTARPHRPRATAPGGSSASATRRSSARPWSSWSSSESSSARSNSSSRPRPRPARGRRTPPTSCCPPSRSPPKCSTLMRWSTFLIDSWFQRCSRDSESE